MSGSTGNVLDSIAHPAQLNVLGAYQNAAQTAGSIYDLRQKQANEALGQAYQQAVDPKTGRFDPLRFNQLVANMPAAAMAAQSGVESSQKLQGEQFTVSAAQRAKVNEVVSSALSIQDPAQRAQYLSRAGADLITSGVVPADRVLAGFMHMPTDPAQQEAYLRGLQYQTYSPEQKQGLTTGIPFKQTGPGGVTIGGTQNAATGAVSGPPQQGLPQGVSPDTMMQVPDLDRTLPNGSPNPNYGRTKTVRAADQPGLNPGGIGIGRPPPALQNPNKPQPAAAPPGVVTGASPGETAQMTAAGPAFDREATTGTNAPQQITALNNMLADTARFVPGKGAEGLKNFQNAVQSWAPGAARFFGIDSGKLGAQESFDKLAAQLALAQGSNTDARLAVTEAATPHSGMTPQGVDMIIRQLQGNSDYLVARAKIANAWPSKSDYTGFANHIAGLDPRIFQMQRMTPTQQGEYFKALPQKTRDELKGAKAAYDRLMAEIQ